MTEFGLSLAAIGALSLTVTKVVDFIRNLIDQPDQFPKWVWNVVALVAGLAICLGWQISIAGPLVSLVPAVADHASTFTGVAGQALSGLVIGAGAGFFHELLDSLSSIANKNNAVAGGVEEAVFEDSQG